MACGFAVKISIYMAKESEQTSPMSKMDGTRLPSTPWPFWTSMSTSGK